MVRTLHADAHVTITLDDETRVVRYTRSNQPYASVDVLRALNKKLREVFDALPPGRLALLLDVRDAPPRNDDAFEGELVGALDAIANRFVARATLVKTAVGRLQAQRIARTRDKTVDVFTDEAAALGHLAATR
jgi:hypothetical protein